MIWLCLHGQHSINSPIAIWYIGSAPALWNSCIPSLPSNYRLTNGTKSLTSVQNKKGKIDKRKPDKNRVQIPYAKSLLRLNINNNSLWFLLLFFFFYTSQSQSTSEGFHHILEISYFLCYPPPNQVILNFTFVSANLKELRFCWNVFPLLWL